MPFTLNRRQLPVTPACHTEDDEVDFYLADCDYNAEIAAEIDLFEDTT